MKNRNIIRIFALILTIVMTLSMFVACKDSSDTPAESSKPAETTKPAEEHEHSYGEAVQTKAPTCTEFGEKTATCSCGKTVVSSIAALGHTYENGKCKNCQADEPHTHTFTNNKCTCGEIFTLAKGSQYDANNDGTKDTFNFSPLLADKYSKAIHISASNYDQTLSVSPSKSSSKNIDHYYITENANPAQKIVYKVNVSEAGIYEMVIHMRLKDNKERGSKYTINGTTTFETSFQPTNDAEIAKMRNADTESTYMYGIMVTLVAGENTITIEQSSASPKCQHYRDLYFLKVS